MRLNIKRGLDRIWACLSLIWITFIAAAFIHNAFSRPEVNDPGFVLSLLAIPPFLLFAVIRGMTWIVEGFVGKSN